MQLSSLTPTHLEETLPGPDQALLVLLQQMPSQPDSEAGEVSTKVCLLDGVPFS